MYVQLLEEHKDVCKRRLVRTLSSFFSIVDLSALYHHACLYSCSAYVLWFFFGTCTLGALRQTYTILHMHPLQDCSVPMYELSCCRGVRLCKLTYVLQRFYVGRPVSGLVWLFTFGLFGIGWLIDVFLIPEFVEEVCEPTT
jgi:hypothetical protein